MDTNRNQKKANGSKRNPGTVYGKMLRGNGKGSLAKLGISEKIK
jgi:hypothetical protein